MSASSPRARRILDQAMQLPAEDRRWMADALPTRLRHEPPAAAPSAAPELDPPAEDALILREGRRLVIEPAPAHSLLDVLARLEPISEDFLPIDELPIDAIEL